MTDISIVWDNPDKTIIRCDFNPDWTWDEFNNAHGEVNRQVRRVNHRVDVILNIGTGGVMPDGALTFLRHLGAETIPVNMGYTVVVTRRLVVRVMWEAFLKVYAEAGENLGWKFADTLADAREVLARQALSS